MQESSSIRQSRTKRLSTRKLRNAQDCCITGFTDALDFVEQVGRGAPRMVDAAANE